MVRGVAHRGRRGILPFWLLSTLTNDRWVVSHPCISGADPNKAKQSTAWRGGGVAKGESHFWSEFKANILAGIIFIPLVFGFMYYFEVGIFDSGTLARSARLKAASSPAASSNTAGVNGGYTEAVPTAETAAYSDDELYDEFMLLAEQVREQAPINLGNGIEIQSAFVAGRELTYIGTSTIDISPAQLAQRQARITPVLTKQVCELGGDLIARGFTFAYNLTDLSGDTAHIAVRSC